MTGKLTAQKRAPLKQWLDMLDRENGIDVLGFIGAPDRIIELRDAGLVTLKRDRYVLTPAGRREKRLLDVLAECDAYYERGNLYWHCRASMAKLAERGLAEQYVPPSVPPRLTTRPYRPTDAGRAALKAQEER